MSKELFSEVIREETKSRAREVISALPDRPEYHQDPFAFPRDVALRLLRELGRFTPFYIGVVPAGRGLHEYKTVTLKEPAEESVKAMKAWARENKVIALMLVQTVPGIDPDGKRIGLHLEIGEKKKHGLFGLFGFDVDTQDFVEANHKEPIPRGNGITRII